MNTQSISDVLALLSTTDDPAIIQDSLWEVGFHFHYYSSLDRLRFLHGLTKLPDNQSPVVLFWMVIYLRSAYFSIMEIDEKRAYLNLLIKLGSQQHGFFLAEAFELTGRLFGEAPIDMQGALIRMLLENIPRADANVLCAMCDAVSFMVSTTVPEHRNLLREISFAARTYSDDSYLREAADDIDARLQVVNY